MEASDRVLLIAVDDSEDSQKAFMWAVDNLYREGDQIHLVHVVPRLAFAAQYGVPPVDFVPAAENSSYESAVQRAEQFIIDRFVRALPVTIKSPVVHIIKVGSCCSSILKPLILLIAVMITYASCPCVLEQLDCGCKLQQDAVLHAHAAAQVATLLCCCRLLMLAHHAPALVFEPLIPLASMWHQPPPDFQHYTCFLASPCSSPVPPLHAATYLDLPQQNKTVGGGHREHGPRAAQEG